MYNRRLHGIVSTIVRLFRIILTGFKGSKPSLIAGGLVGLIYLLAGYLTYNRNSLGLKIGLANSILLTFVGFIRSFLTRFLVMVPLVLLYLGVLSVGYYAYKLWF